MPPTITYPLTTFASLILLSLVGLGPSLYLLSRLNSRRVQWAILISPAVALAEIGVVFYPLFLNGIPVDRYAVPMALLLVGISLGLAVLDFRSRRLDYVSLFTRASFKYLAAFGLIFVLLMLPAYVGGDRYRYWQRNAYDATNYWALTYVAQHFPFTQTTSDPAGIQSAIQLNPIMMPVIKGGGIFTRAVVELPFAWLSLLFNIPLYEFYYYFKLLGLAVTFPTALALAKRLQLSPSFTLALAAILSIGFWAWVISDLDALSSVYSLPLGILFVFAWLQLEEDAPFRLWSRQRFLFSLSFAALLGYYPEAVPLTVAALLVYYARLLLDFSARENLRRALSLLASAALVALIILPTLGKIWGDVLNQSNSASLEFSDVWAAYYFSWLYTREMLFAPLWGLLFYRSDSRVNVLVIAGIAIGLGTIVVVGVVKNIFGRTISLSMNLVSSLLFAYWGGALVIFLIGRDWVAGKALGMSAPFVIIAICVYAHEWISTQTVRKFTRLAVAFVFTAWCMSQVLIPVVRALYMSDEQWITNYFSVESQIGDIVPVMNHLTDNPPEMLVSYFPQTSEIVALDWQMMLSDQFRHFLLGGLSTVHSRAKIEAWQQFDTAPSQVLFDTPNNYLKATGLGTLVPLENTPFQLYNVTPSDLNEAVFRSNFIAPDDNNAFVSANLRFASPYPEPVRLLVSPQGQVRFLAGNNSPARLGITYNAVTEGALSLTLNGTTLIETLAVEPGTMGSFDECIMLKAGANDVQFDYQTTDDLAVSPLEIPYFRVMPADETRIDVGAVNDGMFAANGWYGRESSGDLSFRWAPKIASFTVRTCSVGDYTLRFSAFPFTSDTTQSVTISINGASLEPIELGDGLRDYEIQIPAALLNVDGNQSFVFEHAYVETPLNDMRTLAAFYDTISLLLNPA